MSPNPLTWADGQTDRSGPFSRYLPVRPDPLKSIPFWHECGTGLRAADLRLPG